MSARTDDHSIDLQTSFHYNEICDHSRPIVGEIDGERPGAIGVHRVCATGWSVCEVGDDHAVDGDRVDLSEPAVAVKLSHRHAHHWTDGA